MITESIQSQTRIQTQTAGQLGSRADLLPFRSLALFGRGRAALRLCEGRAARHIDIKLHTTSPSPTPFKPRFTDVSKLRRAQLHQGREQSAQYTQHRVRSHIHIELCGQRLCTHRILLHVRASASSHGSSTPTRSGLCYCGQM